MPVGKYAGKPVDTLPHSYLRWVLGQKFPKEILRAAKSKLEKSEYNDLHISISRHAVDMFSKRFLFYWIKKENIRGEEGDGLGTFIAKTAEVAWRDGKDVSKNRYDGDGVVKSYDDILWVFNVSPEYPEYKDLITIMLP